MSSCHRCGKPVYFAERKTSLGKEWHRACLKCEECGKVLNPGQHAEHKGQPYCHLPCYSLLFGPHITGYGVSAGAYNSYGDAGTMKKRIESYTIGGVDKEEILSKLQHYNDHYSGKNGQLDYKEVNGRLLISGLLRLHWRVDKQIQFAPKDDVPIAEKMSRACRKSYMMAINNGLDNMEPLQSFQIYDDTTPRRSPSKPLNGTTPTVAPPTDAPPTVTPPRRERTGSSDDTIIMREKKSDIRRFHTVCYKGEKRKRYSINGHFYDSETSAFTPAHGTVTTVRVSSLNSTQEVIRALLDKFKVENKSDEFCLIEARRNGEMKRLLSTDYPLFERVLLGPQEDEAKIYIMESEAIAPVPQDVNQYASLPEALLRGFIGKLHGEEEEAANRIRTRFARYRDKLQLRLMEVTGQSEI